MLAFAVFTFMFFWRAHLFEFFELFVRQDLFEFLFHIGFQTFELGPLFGGEIQVFHRPWGKDVKSAWLMLMRGIWGFPAFGRTRVLCIAV